MSDTVIFELDAQVARIALNRPAQLNAFNEEMHLAVQAALKKLPASGARVLVLTGSGRGFCAGQDLGDRNVVPGKQMPDLGNSLEKFYNPIIRGLRELEFPVICALNGVAAGAGANLALACDIVIAARSASFIQSFCKLGLVPDSGGSYQLPRLLGNARAMGLAMLGDKLSAERAKEWGLIWDCVDDDALTDTVNKLASHLATQPTKGLAKIKQAIYAAGTNSLDQQLDLERDLQRLAGRSADYREGVHAFMEKRPPKFSGQ